MQDVRRIVGVKPGVVLALALSICALGAPAGHAATFTVNNTTDDDGPCPTPTTCSLRQALAEADVAGGSDVVEFDLPAGSVISLTDGPLIIVPAIPADAVSVRGPGAAALTVRPDPAAPPASVFENVYARAQLSGLTISGGEGGPFSGGGINNGGTMTLDRVVVTQNTSDASGAGAAGGIVNSANLTIRNSTLHANTVTNAGSGGSGGAMVNAGDLVVVNSTFTDNHVTGPGPGPGDGGALLAFGATTVISSTIAGNSAANGAGGISGLGFGMANSILAQNTASPSPDCATVLESQGYNILGDPTGCTVTAAAGDQVGTGVSPLNPLLGPLAGNGGPTPTLALADASPARDAGSPATPTDASPTPPPDLLPCATTDQRGVARPSGARCDIGAFEVVVPPPVAPPPPAAPPPPPVTPPPAPPAAPPFVAPPIDTFKCYGAGETGFVRRGVRVRDQFATRARTTRLRQTTLVCNPAAKTRAAIREPRAHLVCYQSRDVSPFRARRVSVTNQFGTRVLRVVKPVSLCVPSLKRQGGRAPGTSPDPQRRLDHFRCYAVDPKQTARTVTLVDQFVTSRTNTVSVVRVCNPVSKNGGAVRKPAAHLVCYSIRDVVASKVRAVTVRNQFGVARLRVGKARSLCVPSFKRDLGTARAARAANAWLAQR